MRIVLTIPHFSACVGGAEAFAVGVFRLLAERGHDIRVIAVDGHADDPLRLRIAPVSSWDKEVAGLRPCVAVDWGLTTAADIHRLGGGTHQEFMRYSLLGRSSLGRAGKYLEYWLAVRHRRALRAEAALLSRPESRLLAVSRFVAEQVRRTAPVAEARLGVLHNGVDVTRFSPSRLRSRREQVRARLGLASDAVAFVFVAHNLRLKNFALLRSVFAALHDDAPAVRLVVVGKRRPRCHAPWCIYAGATSEPEDFYAAADALVHPTYYDACANVVLEALAAGLPVVSSNLNGSAELLDNLASGFVLPVLGKAAEVRQLWVNSLLALATDASLRRRVGRAARDVARQHSLPHYVDRFEALLAEVGERGLIPAA